MWRLLLLSTWVQILFMESLKGEQVSLKGSLKLTDSTSPSLTDTLELVYPFFTNATGDFIASLSPSTDNQTSIYFRDDISSSTARKSRHLRGKFSGRRLLIGLEYKDQKFILKLRTNHRLIARGVKLQLFPPERSRSPRSVSDSCLYVGRIVHQQKSRVAVDVCNGMTGLIQTEVDAYFIQPVLSGDGNSSVAHTLTPVKSNSSKVSSLADDLWLDENGNKSEVWSSNDVVSAVVKTKDKFMSVTVVADHSVINFHGSGTEQFILMLMNIVNAIYSDPSLGAKLTITVTRIILLKTEEESKIIEGNPRVSLENVCNWFKHLNIATPSSRRHDVGLYLTRLDIGGPAGYAPVGGMCNYRRSCSLNRDEGLTSAFIIAHEIGHILGFSHDGDKEEGNTCSDEGSVMAPLVLATFNRFHWSQCTSREYHSKINKWYCLANKPLAAYPQDTLPTPMIQEYSLDDQCRLEFGQGFRLCRSFVLSDPCTHLWCSNHSSPQMCKTKKGPPLEGTPCGRGKWCSKGYCQQMTKQHTLWEPIQRNPRHGGWGPWSGFMDCSRSCGGGVHFRTRKCNNPKPAFGGKYCEGKSEEFEMCNVQNCLRKRDFRAEQCANLPRLVHLESRLSKLSWLPYPSNNESLWCKLTCIAKKSRETFISRAENVIDGTPCSYDIADNICVQGQCEILGCDRVLGSNKTEDRCGICGGDNTLCKNVQRVFVRTPTKLKSRIIMLPRGARRIEIREVSSTINYLVLQSRRSEKVFLNGKKITEEVRIFVTEGTKFIYSRSNSSEFISARGPLLGDVIVMTGPIKKGGHMMITVNYTVPLRRNLDIEENQKEFYLWDYGNWSRCSRVCGGGVQFSRLLCRDKRTNQIVRKRFCSLIEKPNMKRRQCNTFHCTYRWWTLDWENCDRTCGSIGIQHRMVLCSPINDTSIIVNNDLCRDGRPNSIQPCNRIKCPLNWQVDDWSPCSSTCGIGVQYRNVTCIPSDNEVLFTCSEDKPESIRECINAPCDQTDDCVEDASEFCELKVLHRYCHIPDYYKMCCQSCNTYINKM